MCLIFLGDSTWTVCVAERAFLFYPEARSRVHSFRQLI